jgi:hypothetical protein
MTKPKVLRPFDSNDNYFCIKQVMQVYTGFAKAKDGQPKYLYMLGGLGSDDKLYRYTPSGWAELRGV